MSASRKGKPHSKEHNEAVSEARRGTKLSDAHKKHLRESHLGYVMPEEQKRKISENCKGKGKKAVLQFDLNGNFIKRFEGIQDVFDELGIRSTGNITLVCNGKRKNAYGYIWKYDEREKIA